MSSGITTAVAAVVIFGGIILFHEFGHFIVAKKSGITVFEFAIGMGPAIYKKEINGTLYSLRAIPIGGYVLLEGEDDAEESFSEGSFSQKPLLNRLAVMAAGSFNNLVLGYLLLLILTIMNGYVGTTYVAVFEEGSVSSQTLMLGDKITHMNGHRVRTSNDITYEFIRDEDGLIDMKIIREGVSVELEPIQFKMQHLEDGVSMIDMDFKVAAVPAKVLDYIVYPVNWGMSIVKQVWGSFTDIITGRYSVNQLSGPVGVVNAIGEASKMGIKSLIMMAAFLTINIGIFNLLPFPVLDGGKIVINIFEDLFKVKINRKVLEIIMTVSILLLIVLMVYVTMNDVYRLFQ